MVGGDVGGNSGEPCREWTTGPYCRLCNVSDGSRYYDEGESACLECQGSVAVFFAVGAVAVLALLLLLRWCLRSKPCELSPKLARLWRRVSRVYRALSLRAKLKQMIAFYQERSPATSPDLSWPCLFEFPCRK